MKRKLTDRQFQTLLQDPVFTNFELENSWGMYQYNGKDILIVEGKEFNVEADVAINLCKEWSLYGIRHKDIDISIGKIIDDECNEYQFTPEQERIFENHFKKNITEYNLVFPYEFPMMSYELPKF